MSRVSESTGQPSGGWLLDMLPSLLAGFALLGPTLGLGDGAPALLELDRDTAATPLILGVAGLVFGFDRARDRGSPRLGIGIACCAFAVIYAGVQFV